MPDKYKATMTRFQWRETYIRCQVVPPTHRESDAWLADVLKETHDVAEVIVKASTGDVKAKPFENKRGEEPVTLDLSLSAIRGIKFAAIRALLGYNSQGGAVPAANRLAKATILDSLKDVGPDGAILKKVLKEAKLPESHEADDGDDLFGDEEETAETAETRKGGL